MTTTNIVQMTLKAVQLLEKPHKCRSNWYKCDNLLYNFYILFFYVFKIIVAVVSKRDF